MIMPEINERILTARVIEYWLTAKKCPFAISQAVGVYLETTGETPSVAIERLKTN